MGPGGVGVSGYILTANVSHCSTRYVMTFAKFYCCLPMSQYAAGSAMIITQSMVFSQGFYPFETATGKCRLSHQRSYWYKG